jgi:hypothetical protein
MDAWMYLISFPHRLVTVMMEEGGRERERE